MQLLAQAAVPMLIILAAALWTVVDFWLHPVWDLDALPWPVRRSVYEGLVVSVTWFSTAVLYWQAFRWGMLYQGLGAGVAWFLITLYCSTVLRQRAIDKASGGRW